MKLSLVLKDWPNDHEIDREALAKALGLDYKASDFSDEAYMDYFISTMPNWLKRTK